jgi:hypothetical protein
MNRRVTCALAILTLVVTAAPASAQWRLGGALGAEHESSWDDFIVLTFEARKPIISWNTEIAPRVSYFLRDDVTRLQFDVNWLKPLELSRPGSLIPYVGIGGALELFSSDGFDQNSLGFNYVFGATKRTTGKLQWYGQFQYTVLNDAPNTALIGIGILFRQ